MNCQRDDIMIDVNITTHVMKVIPVNLIFEKEMLRVISFIITFGEIMWYLHLELSHNFLPSFK